MNHAKVTIRNIDLHYQFADGGETWYQGKGIYEILDMAWNCKLIAGISPQNKLSLNCEWERFRPVSWFLNVAGIKSALLDRPQEYLTKSGQTGYALLQSFVRMQAQAKPEQQALPMPMPTPEDEPAPEPVKAEPVNTEANLAGLNVTPDAMARKMSSREIAELTGKKHYNILRDVRALIEQEAITALNFECSTYADASGKSNPEYLLDFDATMTLVTGYDAVLRAKVIRRWRELETGEVRPAMPKAPEPAPCKTWGENNMSTAAMLAEFKAWKGVAVECGLDNNAACISANGVLDRNYGVSPLQIARIQLIAPGNEQYLIPSAIADILAQDGLCNPGTRGAQTVNAALAHMGLQTNTKDSITGKNNWHVTVSGKEAGARIIDTTKRDNHGKMVQQILWPLSIVDTLKAGFFRQ